MQGCNEDAGLDDLAHNRGWGVATHKEDVSAKEMAERAQKAMQAA